MVCSGGNGMTSSDWKRTALSTSLSGTKGRSISRVMARSPAMPTITDVLENWPFFHSLMMASVTAETVADLAVDQRAGRQPDLAVGVQDRAWHGDIELGGRTALVPMSRPTVSCAMGTLPFTYAETTLGAMSPLSQWSPVRSSMPSIVNGRSGAALRHAPDCMRVYRTEPRTLRSGTGPAGQHEQLRRPAQFRTVATLPPTTGANSERWQRWGTTGERGERETDRSRPVRAGRQAVLTPANWPVFRMPLLLEHHPEVVGVGGRAIASAKS